MENIENLAKIDGLFDKEEALKEFLLSANLSKEKLELLRSNPSIKRHQSLIHIVDLQEQSQEFNVSNVNAQNESFLRKFLWAIGLGP